MDTAIYAVMHFAVDFLCALAMFTTFREGSHERLLIYNFCAFALQMPLGTLLDLLRDRAEDSLRGLLPKIWAVAGAALTIVGAVVHPALLGVGNALFHVGGGLDVIAEDFEKNRGGRNLGVFVAPGAVGLYLGTGAGQGGTAAGLILAVLAVLLLYGKRNHRYEVPPSGSGGLILGLCCFAVVILRSFVGLSVTFPWKSGVVFGWLAVTAVALGKMAGGFCAARFGTDRTIWCSLILAAVCFAFGEYMPCGLAALLLFNMTMPVTLYLLAHRMPGMPGFAFGLLTFGLFLGFLPVYARLELPVSGSILGAAGSILSLLLLVIGRKAVRKVHAPS